MINFTVSLSGPGGIVNSPAEVIKKALEDAGATVTISNECPDDLIITERPKPLKGLSIDLKVIHNSWGG